jgi:hypothetical protein
MPSKEFPACSCSTYFEYCYLHHLLVRVGKITTVPYYGVVSRHNTSTDTHTRKIKERTGVVAIIISTVSVHIHLNSKIYNARPCMFLFKNAVLTMTTHRNTTLSSSLTRKLILSKHPKQRISNEAVVTTSELLRLFILEARSRASLEVSFLVALLLCY